MEIEGTYTSLQQEVEVKTKKLKKVIYAYSLLLHHNE